VLSGVSFWFPEAAAPALSHIDLRIDPGEMVLLCGPSGSGKSTLLRLLLGLVPQFSGGRLAGNVSVLGIDPTMVAPRLVAAHGVALLAQNPVEGFVADRVADEVSFGPQYLGLEPAEVAGRVDQALQAVGLSGFHRRRLTELSLGQQQRVALAAAMAMKPQVLLLDEPTAHLHERAAREVLELVAELRAQTGIAVVLGEHRVGLALPYIERVVILVDGRVVADGTPENTLTSPFAIESGVPVPRVIRAGIEFGLNPPPLTPGGLASALFSFPWAWTPPPSPPRRGERGSQSGSVSGGPWVRAAGEKALVEQRLGRLPTWWPSHSPLPVGDNRALAQREHRASGGGEGKGVGSPSDGVAREILLRFDHVSFTYKDSPVPAPRDVSLDIRAGEVVALVGSSGSGKSTLSRLALGLLLPDTGRVVLSGVETRGARVSDLAQLGGLVLQNPLLQLLAETVEDELRLGLLNVPLADQNERVARVLERFDLQPFANRHPLTLSEGQRRRVALAATLVREPSLLVLDEPTLGQDEHGRSTLAAVTREVVARGGAVLAISHDPEFVNDACDRVAVLEDGAVTMLVSLTEGQAAVALERAGVALGGIPQASLVLARLGRGGYSRTPAQLATQAARGRV